MRCNSKVDSCVWSVSSPKPGWPATLLATSWTELGVSLLVCVLGPSPSSRKAGDSNKLQQHLELLREQYVKLQQRHSELEQKYSRALSTSGSVGPDHFVSRLLTLVADLYDKSLYRLDRPGRYCKG